MTINTAANLWTNSQMAGASAIGNRVSKHPIPTTQLFTSWGKTDYKINCQQQHKSYSLCWGCGAQHIDIILISMCQEQSISELSLPHLLDWIIIITNVVLKRCFLILQRCLPHQSHLHSQNLHHTKTLKKHSPHWHRGNLSMYMSVALGIKKQHRVILLYVSAL